MIDSALVAAEFADDTKADDATASDNKEEAKSEEPMKLEVDGDGKITIKSGASSLAASIVTMIAVTSIIY